MRKELIRDKKNSKLIRCAQEGRIHQFPYKFTGRGSQDVFTEKDRTSQPICSEMQFGENKRNRQIKNDQSTHLSGFQMRPDITDNSWEISGRD